jgi:hypothetical protein
MRNMIAVYSPKSGITTARFAKLGADCGYAIRFLTFGLGVPPGDFRGDRTLFARPGQDYFVCGWRGPGGEESSAFDAACLALDRNALQKLMKAGDVRWFELFSHQFDYSSSCRKNPKYQAKVDAPAPPDALPVIRSAKSRYIFHNRNRSWINEDFMLALASALVPAIGGALVDHIRPGR